MKREYSQPYLNILNKRCRTGRRLVITGTILVILGIVLILIGIIRPMTVKAGLVEGTTSDTRSFDPVENKDPVFIPKKPVILDIPGMDVPEEIRKAAEKIGAMYNIQPEFIIAVCYVESQYNRNAVNNAGTCHGLMQVYTEFHLDRMARLGVTDIYSVYGNILVATDYLAELFDKYEDPATVLMVYNGDSKATDWDYFSGYAEDVLTLAANLERAAGK